MPGKLLLVAWSALLAGLWLSDGRPAALMGSGETILVHDYEKARHLLAKAGR